MSASTRHCARRWPMRRAKRGSAMDCKPKPSSGRSRIACNMSACSDILEDSRRRGAPHPGRRLTYRRPRVISWHRRSSPICPTTPAWSGKSSSVRCCRCCDSAMSKTPCGVPMTRAMAWQARSGAAISSVPTRLAMRLEVGTAWVNQHRATAANVPFGGAKESGIGRNYAELGLKGNMEVRVISVLKG